MRRTILMLLAALVVLGSAQAFATSPEVTVAAARSRLVDYPETHPLVWGEFDKYHYPQVRGDHHHHEQLGRQVARLG